MRLQSPIQVQGEQGVLTIGIIPTKGFFLHRTAHTLGHPGKHCKEEHLRQIMLKIFFLHAHISCQS